MRHLDLWKATSPYRFFGRDFPTTNNFFDNVFDGMADTEKWVPACQVHEAKNCYELKFDLPGMSKDQIKIDLHDNRLIVSGERKEEKKSDDKSTHISEVSYGSFMRSFQFPTEIDAEKSEAKYENGVLMITVNKKESAAARQITIK